MRRLLLSAALALAGCAGGHDETVELACPSRDVFEGTADGGQPGAGVSDYVGRRCGTLDCHGSSSRPMRLYGELGLRHPTEANVPGGAATTPIERDANYTSVCGVDPEGMAADVADFGQSAEELLMVRKARGVEGHKGGQVVDVGDPADRCIVGWLRNDPPAVVSADCAAAVSNLE